VIRLGGRGFGVGIFLIPLVSVFLAALLLLSNTIEQKTQFQIDAAQSSAEHDLTSLVDFARSQSAAFASTSFIGYSIGRYYGFAPAFAQISPDPERAAALLRKYYVKGQPNPAEMPPSLAPFASVHDRFHPSFESLISSTLFDDLYLVDHFGRVVYSLQKDSEFAADLTQPSYRDTPLAEAFRQVMAQLQQTSDPQQVLFVSNVLKLGDNYYGVLLARPVIRHDVVEGVVAFRMPLTAIEQRLAALRRPGIRILVLDDKGAPITATQAAAAPRETVHGPFVLPLTGWQYVVLADHGALSGSLWFWFITLVAAGIGAVALSYWSLRRLAVAVPMPAPMAGLPAPTATVALLSQEPALAEAEPNGDHDSPETVPAGDKLIDAQLEANEGFRQSIVEVMTLALDYWQRTKHKGKIELAEDSGLWRVYMDRSSLQTRTLDKYLLVETLPRNPRWRDVVRTAEYVLRNAAEALPERERLVEALARLKLHLRQAERV
jgi:hypothetical protein